MGCLGADTCAWGSAWVKQRRLWVRADVTPRQGVPAPSISHRDGEKPSADPRKRASSRERASKRVEEAA